MRNLIIMMMLGGTQLACLDKQGDPSSTGQTETKASLPVATATADAPAVNTALDASATVATWDGGTMNYADGTLSAQGQLAQMKAEYMTNKYSAEKGAIEQAVIEKLLDAETKKNGHSTTEELLKIEVENKISAPTELEVRATYEQFKSRLQGMPEAEALTMVRTQLERQKQSERFMIYLEELKKSYNLKINLPYPDIPRSEVSADDDPFLGPADAPVTIIQFAEFECPYCGRGDAVMKEVREAYGDKVKIVYRDFPLDFHQRAIPAAVAANCAGAQDKFWEMHGILMSNQDKLQDSDLLRVAKEVGVADIPAWETCTKDPSQVAEVKKDQQDGAKAGVQGTPAFFVNGIFLNGAQPFSEFKSIIDRELEG